MMNQIHPEPLSGTLVDILEETAARYPEHGIFHVASGDTSEEFQSYPVRRAKDYLSGALAAMLDLGAGSGPVRR
jgi:hypothetical protein